MSKLTDKLRERGVFNPHNFYGPQPYIGQRVKGGSRDVVPSSWQVHKAGLSLSTAWYDYGAKSFSYSGVASRKEALAEAIAWASERFGIKNWAKDPFGSYGDAEYIRNRIKELTSVSNQTQVTN
jgi:hypothetical protein